MAYPAHIYDETRLKIAEQLIEKELAKLLGDDRKVSHDTIQSWRTESGKYRLEEGVRDFWDIFAAVIESIKLKPSFTALLTAENYEWKYEEIEVASVQLSSPLDTLSTIPGFVWSSHTTVGDVMNLISTNELMTQQKQNSDEHSRESQNTYPILVRKTETGENRVMDGNRRLLRAALYGQPTIHAWVAHMKDDIQPENYWVPVNDLMQLVKLYVAAKSDSERQAVRDSIEILFRTSDIAKITFNERVREMRGAKELMVLEPST